MQSSISLGTGRSAQRRRTEVGSLSEKKSEAAAGHTNSTSCEDSRERVDTADAGRAKNTTPVQCTHRHLRLLPAGVCKGSRKKKGAWGIHLCSLAPNHLLNGSAVGVPLVSLSQTICIVFSLFLSPYIYIHGYKKLSRFLWTRNEGLRSGSRRKHHCSWQSERTVMTDSTTTTHLNLHKILTVLVKCCSSSAAHRTSTEKVKIQAQIKKEKNGLGALLQITTGNFRDRQKIRKKGPPLLCCLNTLSFVSLCEACTKGQNCMCTSTRCCSRPQEASGAPVRAEAVGRGLGAHARSEPTCWCATASESSVSQFTGSHLSTTWKSERRVDEIINGNVRHAPCPRDLSRCTRPTLG